MNINKTSITWTDIIHALIHLYEAPKQLLLQNEFSTMKQSSSTANNPHQSLQDSNLTITSLYHQRFFNHFPDQDNNFKQIIQQIDIEQPKQYNLGRSFESAFAFTKNHQFVLKKISASNFFYFKRVFYKDYFTLVEQGTSLLAKIYGVFLLEKQEKQSENQNEEHSKTPNYIHFILMENLFFTLYKQPSLSKILMIFDLKGATINRSNQTFKTDYLKQQQQINKLNQDKDSLIDFIKGKDNDLIQLGIENPLKQLKKEELDKFLKELEKETQHFENSNIMDYSVMMIVWWNNEKLKKIHWNQIPITDNCYITLGIIDYLQEYNSSKKMETKVKNFFGMFKQNNEISCVNSLQYRQRFLQYFAKMTE